MTGITFLLHPVHKKVYTHQTTSTKVTFHFQTTEPRLTLTL